VLHCAMKGIQMSGSLYCEQLCSTNVVCNSEFGDSKLIKR